MIYGHPDHPGRRVRLAYCLNLHPAEDLEQTIAGMRAITLPLRDRLARKGEIFGVGMYLPAQVAGHLASSAGVHDLERLAEFVTENGLDPFTYNAFPYGGFHRSGLKSGVFLPTWAERSRLDFTLDVARVAARLARAAAGSSPGSHISISTHSGAFGTPPGRWWDLWESDRYPWVDHFVRAAEEFRRLEEQDGVRIILSPEAEPRASSGDTQGLLGFMMNVRYYAACTLQRPKTLDSEEALRVLARYLGTCLDACHSAVEFEDPATVLDNATAQGRRDMSVSRSVGTGEMSEPFAPFLVPVSLGKLQFSSALALREPREHPRAVEQLLSMDEPRYLHQVTGVGPRGRFEVDDLPQLRRDLARADHISARWVSCGEWRCHFHVPVDLELVGEEGLSTTRDHADALLAEALLHPERWGVAELHLEIETYTWDVLPGPARGAGALVDGLEREYAHVIGRLEAAGWRRCSDPDGRQVPGR